ncbi:hypothetical protein ACHQM5_006399 [Ranunculus cassubicifolius]
MTTEENTDSTKTTTMAANSGDVHLYPVSVKAQTGEKLEANPELFQAIQQAAAAGGSANANPRIPPNIKPVVPSVSKGVDKRGARATTEMFEKAMAEAGLN